MNCSIKRILQFKEAITTQPLTLFDFSQKDITNICQIFSGILQKYKQINCTQRKT